MDLGLGQGELIDAQKKIANRDLPPRMLRRIRNLKSGAQWVGYYDGRDENGKRVEIPLGTNLDVAKMEWAKLDCKAVLKIVRLLGDVFNRYERDVIPAKMPRTQKDNLLSLKQLRAAFSDAPIDTITPQIIAQYRDKRSGKVRANREVYLLSHIYNMAREWDITEKENPVAGVRNNKERPRDFYAGPEVWDAVYQNAVPELRDAMDLAYLSGQRPADVLAMRAADCVEGFLLASQNKTSKKLRIQLHVNCKLNQLGVLVERLLERRRTLRVRNPYLIVTEDGRHVTASMLRLRFDDARKAAVQRAQQRQDTTLASLVTQFKFRDIRQKAASEIVDLGHASRLLGHTDKRITATIYRRIGETVLPTR